MKRRRKARIGRAAAARRSGARCPRWTGPGHPARHRRRRPPPAERGEDTWVHCAGVHCAGSSASGRGRGGRRYGASVSIMETIPGDAGDEPAQGQSAAFVADPAGHPDVEVEVQVGVERGPVPGEAVDDGAREPCAPARDDGEEALVGVALVEKDGHAEPRREIEMGLERAFLVGPRREVAVEIEAGLPDGDDFGLRGKPFQGRRALRAPLARVVRVHPRGGEQHPRRGAGDVERGGALRLARTGDHDLRHPRLARAGEHLLAVAIERFVPEVGADVDELHVKRSGIGAWSVARGAGLARACPRSCGTSGYGEPRGTPRRAQ